MCLNAGGMGRIDAESETLIPINGAGFDVAHTLRGGGFDASEDGTGRGTPIVAVAMNLRGREGGAMPELDDKASLRAADGGSSRSYVAFQTKGSNLDIGDIAGTIASNSDRASGSAPMVAFECKQHGQDAGDIAPALRAMGHAGSHANGGGQIAVAFNWAVRRLTPTECARLQGFPDDHARIAWRGKPADQCPDGPQYRAYGNSMAVPVLRWILTRMEREMGREMQRGIAARAAGSAA